MPVQATDYAVAGTGQCFMSPTATSKQGHVFAEVHIAST